MRSKDNNGQHGSRSIEIAVCSMKSNNNIEVGHNLKYLLPTLGKLTGKMIFLFKI